MIFILFITLFLKVCFVLGETSFINNGQRAELFEKMDNEISTFNITLPDIEFDLLKFYTSFSSKSNGYIQSFDDRNDSFNNNIKNFYDFLGDISYDLRSYKAKIEYLLKLLKLHNFKKEYPNFNFKKFSFLKISNKGYLNFNENEILKEFNFEPLNYYSDLERYYENDNLKILILQSNRKYNILNLLMKLSEMTTFTNSEMDNDLNKELVFFKFIIKNKDGKFQFNESDYNEFIETYENNNSINDDVTPYNLEEKHFERIYNHLEEIKKNMKRKLELLKKINFKKEYPNFDFSKKLPNLKVNKKGISNINIDNIMKGFKFNLEDYTSLELGYDYNDLNIMVHQSNPKFDLLNILTTLSNITTFNNSKKDDEFTRRLVYFKFISKNENNTYIFDTNSYHLKIFMIIN
ncbi:hypothetical protein BCR32DRAFT_242144 [Anaeromyces robustus]|uniref:Uncharacterized protein n=1 Tax=Anaeromyces robustus TaxID=1754192 RepID=A0A1Y1XH33_9FUNG|nr:hypothetical protein BCR32DRAFT_242144 [Anaeromyces robustus]|eukprot:ORX85033.1 hypothetical protein BCR32DRAFT_242144 [Anaeromyces robustus]